MMNVNFKIFFIMLYIAVFLCFENNFDLAIHHHHCYPPNGGTQVYLG